MIQFLEAAAVPNRRLDRPPGGTMISISVTLRQQIRTLLREFPDGLPVFRKVRIRTKNFFKN
jgi:hypothetical protein